MAALNKEPDVLEEAKKAPDSKFKKLDIPEGGIAGYAMSEEDFDTLEVEEAEKEFGKDGLAQFTAVAKKMAGHGRFGDDSVAHIQTGEIVVPLSLIENNPALKEQIFKKLRDSGIEDPEQYVVGSKANSINPETGLMEFGFFSRMWRKVKRVFKKVVKVLKKVSTIVLPIALSMTPLGPVFGAALGSGIASLINGGSLSDALKSGLISGAMGGITAGFSGPAEGAGSFMKNLGAATTDPLGRAAATWEGATSTLTGGGFTGSGNFFSDYVNPSVDAAATTPPVENAAATTPAPAQASANANVLNMSGDPPQFQPSPGESPFQSLGDGTVEDMRNFNPSAPKAQLNAAEAQLNAAGAVNPVNKPEQSILDKALSYVTGNAGEPAADVAQRIADSEAAAGAKYIETSKKLGLTATAEGYASARAGGAAAAQPTLLGSTMLAKYGPGTALAGAGLYASGALDGAFTAPEIEPSPGFSYDANGNVVIGLDLVNADPGEYMVRDLGQGRVLDPETGTYSNASAASDPNALAISGQDTNTYTPPEAIPYSPFQRGQQDYFMPGTPGGPFSRPYVTAAAEGGPIFPRRNGGIAPNEGTPGADSVRAMLMPGEFVMTTDAVRGLGNGDLNSGIQNMYSVMRNLESRGRQAA